MFNSRYFFKGWGLFGTLKNMTFKKDLREASLVESCMNPS